MSHRDRLSAFAEQVGFTVTMESDIVVAKGVPCLFANRTVGSCTIEKSFDPVSRAPNGCIGSAVHAVRITTDGAQDGRVYHADGTPIGNYLNGDKQTWSNISIRKGSPSSPEGDASASEVIYRYAKQIVGAVAESGSHDLSTFADPGPFKIPNTFEARAAVGPMQDCIRDQRIAIIGLGGTGAYVLDLIAKTPVAEIHLLDSDEVDWHNFMRAPGAPTAEEIELRHKGCLRKVDYYHAKYASLREGIHAHAVQVNSPSMFAELLSGHPVDYAFVCIDQRKECESPRQDVVYDALSEAGVPFIDSGVSITLENDSVSGSVTTSAYAAGSLEWKDAIPNARVEGNAPGYRNVQLPEVNALAASLGGYGVEAPHRSNMFRSRLRSSTRFRLETPLHSPERDLTRECGHARETPTHFRGGVARASTRNQVRRALDHAISIPDRQPALSLRLRRSDRPVTPPQPLARSLRW